MAPSDPRALLTRFSRIAVVGASRDPRKDAHQVPAFLASHGWEVTPVNPGAAELFGRRAYPTIAEVPGPLEIVAVFRPGPETPPHVAAALEAGAQAIWLPTDVRSERSRELAMKAGVPFVEDVCLRVAHQRLFGLDGMRRSIRA